MTSAVIENRTGCNDVESAGLRPVGGFRVGFTAGWPSITRKGQPPADAKEQDRT